MTAFISITCAYWQYLSAYLCISLLWSWRLSLNAITVVNVAIYDMEIRLFVSLHV